MPLCAPGQVSLTKPNTFSAIEKPASLRSDGVRDHPGMPFGFLRNRRSASLELLGSLKLKFASQMEALFDCRDFATSIAVSSWGSLSSFNASRESSIENLGMMPLFSSIRPCQVRYAATGNPRM